MRILIFPLLIMGAVASYVAGLGFATRWHTLFPLEFVVGFALHASWIVPTISRSGNLALPVLCWFASVSLATEGMAGLYFADSDFRSAVLLEGVCLLLALAISPPEPWPDRLARWRRTRAAILTQLRMGLGILPWLRVCFRQFAVGSADTPLGADYQRLAAALADAEHRLRARLSRAAIPEQLRQSILGNVAAIVARVETTAAQRYIELEQQSLAAAASCREQCERLENISPSERKALAGQCEQALLELTRH